MSNIRNVMIATVAGIATAMAASAASAQANPPPSHLNVYDRMEAAGGFDTFLRLAAADGWDARLAGEAPYDRTEYTVLAPTDESLAAMGTSLDDLLRPENRMALHEFLGAHIISGEYRYADLENNFNSMLDFNYDFRHQHQEKVIDASPVSIDPAEIRASNGVIYKIGTVLTQP